MIDAPSLNLKSALLVTTLALVACLPADAQGTDWQEIASPGGDYRIAFSLGKKGRPLYRVLRKNQEIVAPSGLGLILADETRWIEGFGAPNLTDRAAQQSTWKPIWGERATVEDHFTAAVVRFPRETAPGPLALEVRAYDQGVAFRYLVGKSGAADEITIASEETEFSFAADHELWAVSSAQGKYSRTPLSKVSHSVERPCILETGGGKVVAVAEAALVDYARMRLRRAEEKPHTLRSALHGPVTRALPFTSPWRVIMAGDQPGELLEHNDLFLNLNEPCKIADTSWIKPGKVIREMTLSTEGGLACVDFAVKYGLQFIEFDAGWYGPEASLESDARTVSLRGLDLPRVIECARDHGIGVILYVNRRHLERDLDDLLPLYREWGIAGIKFGFVQHGDQKWTRWMHEAIAKCAEHQIMVDVHDEYRMTGWQRTYPNFMTAEGIGGDETRPPNEQALANFFNRGLCGPADHTFCYFNGYVRERTSHAAQLAKTVLFFSPWQFLFWYDQPQHAHDEPELQFFKHLPTTWHDSRVLQGEIGQFAVVARRSGEEWFLGCLNAGQPRSFELPLAFLAAGGKYEAHIHRDDPSVGTVTKVAIEKRVVDSTTVLSANLSARQGIAVRLVPR